MGFIKSSLLLFSILLCIIGCTSQTSDLNLISNDKIEGISLVASRDRLTQENIDPIKNVNADYVTLMPFGFIKDLTNPEISFNTEQHWYGETKEGITQYTNLLQNNGFKIMLKPQIWIWHGEFTGNLKMDTEQDWLLLETSYSAFILEFAALAQELQIDFFCIGTELEQFVINRPEYWGELIIEIRKTYDGKLTYASNWNEFEKVPFWQRLDYVGIDAYFPLSDAKTPSVTECRQGWMQYKKSIEAVFIDSGKPIIFTEYGFRSVDFTAKEPWNSERVTTEVNLSSQVNALQALFDEFWKEEWFAGGFIWKWHMNHDSSGGENNNRFTPQNKPSEILLKNQYAQNP